MTCFYPMIYLSSCIFALSFISSVFLLLILLLLCPIYGLYYYRFKKSFQSSKLFIRMIRIITRNFRSLLFLKFIAVGLQTAFVAVWCLVLETWIIRYKQNEISSVSLYFIFIYLVRLYRLLI